MKKLVGLLVLFGLMSVGPASANYVIRDGNGASQTIMSLTPGGIILPQHNNTDGVGNPVFDPQPSVRSATVEAYHILKASGGFLYKINVETSDFGFLMVFDSATDPADGPVTPIWCKKVFGSKTLNFLPALKTTSGIVVVFSTTGCFTKTEEAAASFFGQVQ